MNSFFAMLAMLASLSLCGCPSELKASMTPRPEGWLTGDHEFAIVVNSVDHPQIFAEGEKQLADAQLKQVENEGKVQARWVPIAADKKGEPKVKTQNQSEGLIRTVERNGKSIKELLVLVDGQQPETVPMSHVTDAKVHNKEGPEIEVQLDQAGAAKMFKLTKRYRPRRSGETTRMSIIVDGQVHSAPTIRDVMVDRMLITGEFTEEEMRTLVDLFAPSK